MHDGIGWRDLIDALSDLVTLARIVKALADKVTPREVPERRVSEGDSGGEGAV